MLPDHDLRAIHEQLKSIELSQRGNDPLGIFVIDIDQVQLLLTNTPDEVEHFFTPAERQLCQQKIPSLAGRFAGKHAVVEVLGQELPWQNINIGRGQSGKPYVQLTEDALRLAEQKGIVDIPISIAHDEGIAVSFAVGVTEPLSRVALGTDIASVQRIARSYQKLGNHFLRRIYSEQEAEEAQGDVTILTGKWAGKEAVAKALGTGFWEEGVAWSDITILTDTDGLSSLALTGRALEQAQRQGLINWRMHIAHNPNTPLAFVMGSS